MKLHLPRLLAAAVLASLVAVPAYTAEIPDEYKDNTVLVSDADYLADYASNASTDYVAFLLGMDIEVPSDISLSGGNLYFTSRNAQLPVSLAFTGSDSAALTDLSSLVFDTLSGLSFTSYKKGAISTSGNLIIQNVNDGVEDSENPDVFFSGNSASSSSYYGGGAICTRGGDVRITGNGDVYFAGNTATASSSSYGGAIGADSVRITGNGDVLFMGNSVSSSGYSYGGAIRAGSVSITGNGDVTFTGNTSRSSVDNSYGGAIYGNYNSTIVLSNNGSVVFEGNTASGSGGAIYVCYSDFTLSNNESTIELSNNGSVVFAGNTARATSAYASGGAIYGEEFSTIELSDNGNVVFEGNTASSTSAYAGASGGAISGQGCTIELSNNGSVVFAGNTASSTSAYAGAFGGAIYTYGYCNLSIRNNDSVLFEKNAEISDGTYRLRSIYAADCGDIISLSAAAGRSIEFRDSVYIASCFSVNLNADYGDTRQQGDIIFTGKYAEQHLNELLKAADAGRTATAQEILNSRTTEVNALTYLYGGRLRVEDGAIYQGQGITVHEGSDATVLVKDATLSHEGYALTFNAGTTLQVEGESLIVGDVLMMAQSVLNLEGETTINGALTLGLGMQLAGNILAEVQNLQVGESLTLVSGLESLAVQTQNLMRSVEYTTVMDGYEVQASEYFSNLAGNTGLVMRYDSEAGTVSICNTPAVPEPTTATLSLLAFAALAARRRRK